MSSITFTKDGRICTTGLRHGGGDYVPDDWFDNDLTPAIKARIVQRIEVQVVRYGLTLDKKDIQSLACLSESGRDLVLEVKVSNPSTDIASIITGLGAAGRL